MNKFLKLALGAGLYLLDQSDKATRNTREQVSGRIDDLREATQRSYEDVADRVTRAADALRNKQESHAIGNSLRFVAGVGVGVGVALLLAPASGDATRTALSEKSKEFGNTVRNSFSRSTGDLGPAYEGD